MRIILVLILFALSHLCAAQYYPDCTRLFEVNSNDGLLIRKEANENSEIIFKVPNGYHVSACRSSTKKGEVNGAKGNWMPVKYQNTEGFMFDAFLKEISTIKVSSPYTYDPEAAYHVVSNEQVETDPFYQKEKWGLFQTSRA